MTPADRPLVWVVASADTAARWSRHLLGCGYDARALGWSEIACVQAEDAARAALARGPFDRLLATSANAIRCRPAAAPASLGVACVGEPTARAAREAGCRVLEVGPGTGEALARQLLDAAEPPRRVLFLRGREIRRAGVEVLVRAGVEVEEVVVYEARPRASFAAEVAAAPLPRAVVVGSPRAANALLRTGREGLADLPAAAVGPATAEALGALGFEAVRAADRPDPAALASALASLL